MSHKFGKEDRISDTESGANTFSGGTSLSITLPAVPNHRCVVRGCDAYGSRKISCTLRMP